MSEIKLREDYIKLGQALKSRRFCGGSGVDAKFVIQGWTCQSGMARRNIREERNFMMVM